MYPGRAAADATQMIQQPQPARSAGSAQVSASDPLLRLGQAPVPPLSGIGGQHASYCCPGDVFNGLSCAVRRTVLPCIVQLDESFLESFGVRLAQLIAPSVPLHILQSTCEYFARSRLRPCWPLARPFRAIVHHAPPCSLPAAWPRTWVRSPSPAG